MGFFSYPAYTYNDSAAKEIVPLIIETVMPKSVIDIGCGTAIWLDVFEKNGVKNIIGVDHPGNDVSLLKISQEKFIPADLTKPFVLDKKFDLVVSLEVAEHLPAETSDTFVKTLTGLGDLILFSAAVPFQPGDGHINAQWPQYWVEKFKKYDYAFYDFLRLKIWNNENVQWWYKQNIFLAFNKKNNKFNFPESEVLALVHPQLYEEKSEALEAALGGKIGIKATLKILKLAMEKRFGKK